MSSRMTSKKDDVARSIANMESTVGALERQLELRRKKIQRLEESLASKNHIVQGCQDIVDGPLRFVFDTGGLGQMSEESMPSEVLSIFQKKRFERRKRILERLIPIVGETVVTNFSSNTESKTATEDVPTHPLHVLECASGWMASDSGGIVWFGAHIENQSKQSLFNIRLSAAHHDSHGLKLSRLEPGSTGLLVGFIRMDISDLDDDECLDKSLVTKRLMSGSVRLHLDRKFDQNDGSDMYHSTILMTTRAFPLWSKKGCRYRRLKKMHYLVPLKKV
ncbi:hypothetical protein BGX26_005956 [Mortierella sp. AD094]|nr:hypothetical protein BGX26_005956 [Mortierella sp. AD094]